MSLNNSQLNLVKKNNTHQKNKTMYCWCCYRLFRIKRDYIVYLCQASKSKLHNSWIKSVEVLKNFREFREDKKPKKISWRKQYLSWIEPSVRMNIKMYLTSICWVLYISKVLGVNDTQMHKTQFYFRIAVSLHSFPKKGIRAPWKNGQF